MNTLPDHLFFTGVPGSHWSAIAQDLETVPGFNTSDQNDSRDYSPGTYTGHRGAYFGKGMEFDSDIENFSRDCLMQYLNSPWKTYAGTKIVKSHDWAYRLPFIKKTFPEAWIMLVYRPDMTSYAWWHEAGGFSGIKYPSYKAYKDSTNMMAEIMAQNQAILQFGFECNVTWSHYTAAWVESVFGTGGTVNHSKADTLVAVIK
jgi:hypothetical protein